MSETFSIISGIYNHKHLLPKVFAGWEAQTNKDFKVYFCDDGSDDGTKEWIAKQKPKFKFEYFRQPQKGMRLGKNLNQGIKAATGKYAVFVMGDSVPFPDFLEKLEPYLGRKNVLCGMRENVTEDLEHISWDWRFKMRLHQIDRPVLGIQDKPWARMTGNGLVVPMDVLRKVGCWPEDYVGYSPEDNLLIVKLYAEACQFFDVPLARIKHIEHELQPENKQADEDFKKQAKKIFNKFKKEYWPPTIVPTFDDFSPINNNLYFLRKLKKNYPDLRVTLFLIPEYIHNGRVETFLDHPELVEEIKKELDWLELCPHGWHHPNMSEGHEPEFGKITYYETARYIEFIDKYFEEIGLPYKKIFKAPQYEISEAAIDCFRANGYALAIDGTGSLWPKHIKTIPYNWNIRNNLPIRKVIIGYGHIQDIGNGMLECWEGLLQMPPDTDFAFLSEVL